MKLILGFSFLIVFVSSVDGYHLGESEVMCWRNGFGELLNSCPTGVDVTWEVPVPEKVIEGDEFTATSNLHLPASFDIPTVMVDKKEQTAKFIHVNFHACISSMGWCSPQVSKTPNLVSHSAALISNSTEVTMTTYLNVPEQWTIIVHYRFFNRTVDDNGNDVDIMWNVAAGMKRTVLAKEVEIEMSDSMKQNLTGLQIACIGFVVAMLISTIVFRDRWSFKAASPTMLYLMCFGSIIVLISVSSFVSDVADDICKARAISLVVGFDLVFVPLFLKTWRVSKLFDRSMKKLNISNKFLGQVLAAVLSVDIGIIAYWLSNSPIKAEKVFSEVNPQKYVMECVGENQMDFTLALLLVHTFPLVGTAYVSYKVRMTFQFAEHHNKFDKFDESGSVVLALLNLLIISLFVISMQFLVNDNPDLKALMRSLGIMWTASYSIAVIFIPKILDRDDRVAPLTGTKVSSGVLGRNGSLPRDTHVGTAVAKTEVQSNIQE